jgi:hypothetical protein
MTKKLHHKLLGSVVDLMVKAGTPALEVRRSVSGILAKVVAENKKGRSRGKKQQHHEDVVAHLLRLWHRDQRYLKDSNSSPRALPLSKGKNNLASLIAALDPSVSPLKVLHSMSALGLIKQTPSGRYLPTASANLVPRIHPWSLEHTVRSVDRLVDTVCRNASVESGIPSLLERYSYVPDLDPDQANAFAEFSRLQGQLYLDTLDDWLEQRRVRKPTGSKKGIAAGVHLIAYIDDRTNQPKKRALATKKDHSASQPNRPPPRKKPTSLPSASA